MGGRSSLREPTARAHLDGLAAAQSAALVQGAASLQAISFQLKAVLQELAGVHQCLMAHGHAILCLRGSG